MSADFDFGAHDDRLANQHADRYPDWDDPYEEAPWAGDDPRGEDEAEREQACRDLERQWAEDELLRLARAVGVIEGEAA